jgi:hypothetical protein
MTNQYVRYEDFVKKVFTIMSGNHNDIEGPSDLDL